MKTVLIVHNVRSAHNVGSMLRSAEGLGAAQVYLTGYTPYPAMEGDSRLPHITRKMDGQIQKTALGAEKSLKWTHVDDIFTLLGELKRGGYETVALEQTPEATNLQEFKPTQDIALIVGSEVGGIDSKILKMVDKHIEIPMSGAKESLNVSIAAAIALHHLRVIA
ncbi:hypothetical protein BVY00_00655 [bacterium G20]|nr:hypothetical protein BVY00_00655 [bacterium G20]